MRLIKLAFFSFLSLFAVGSLIGLLLPAHVLVSRAVNISAPKYTIMANISNINRWSDWMDGMKNASVNISSPTQADLAGTKVNITHLTDTTVVSNWLTKSGAAQVSTMHVIGAPTQNTFIVQWQFEQQLKWYPWERLGSMMNDKILGTMMEKNLNRLKENCER